MRLVLVIVALLRPDASAKKCIEDRTVTGLVEDAHGAPLPDALVGVSWAVDEQPKGPAIAYTDSEGKFAIPLRIATVCRGLSDTRSRPSPAPMNRWWRRSRTPPS